MVAYLDEYNPNSNSVNYRVQSDVNKLKYNNIQSCIAVAIFPSATNRIVGVHLTTATTGNVLEMKSVRDELLNEMGRVRNATAYLVANYKTHHAGTTLKRELSKIVSQVKLCNISPVSGTNTSADVDVKIEVVGGAPRCYVRAHAPFLTGPAGQARVPKPMPPAGWLPGQNRSHLDKTGLDWVQVEFQTI